MAHSPGSLIPSGVEQSAAEKLDDKASMGRQGGETNIWGGIN
jgi:hypothetical protein